uniref:Uncharacterized protein n=1 Tax=Arundo donax TaxID=35708 RepID=A0A0A9EYL3_ARUDO
MVLLFEKMPSVIYLAAGRVLRLD